ncbi:MAG: dependent ligase [Noviherbaspirillum sp.]|nr:dependent ligase [Noviherbaspirillum sp.]
MPDKLSAYHAKRNFRVTSEPRGEVAAPAERLRFVVQKHDARKLHYDFRLEFDGTLKSWAVPKGPSLDPSEKRLAVHVEDHPLDYMHFEGDIPEQQYGAGHVDVWDTGYWEPQGDPSAGYKAGKLKFRLDGEKLQGGWTLVRTRLQGSKEQWLLIKENDDTARAHEDYDITAELPDSVLSNGSSGKRGKAAKKPSAAPRTASKAVRAKAAKAAPAAPASQRKTPLPELITPQLATLVEEVPDEGEWIYEIKFDGYRILARVDGDDVKLLTRDNKDWTARMPRQVEAIRSLGLESAWLDGEIVVLDEHGVPSFQLLQKAFDASSGAQIAFFLFDLPYLNGYDLRALPLAKRRELLQHVLKKDAQDGALRLSEQIDEPPQKLLDGACAMSMEGIIGKRAGSPYTGKRSADWIKLKCRQRQEFVIGGYTEPAGARKFFGALLLGVYTDDGALRYAGRVGTGFDRDTLYSTYKKLKALEQDKSPFAAMPAGVRRAETHWVKPTLVAEASFAEWTHDAIVRQASFHGLRLDKPAEQIRRERAVSAPWKSTPRNGSNSEAPAPKRSAAHSAAVQGMKISHPDRVIDAESGMTKLDLARYYEQIAPFILPYLKRRPVYLLRAPEGVGGELFFQKHSGRLEIPCIGTLDPSVDPDHAPLMVIESPKALLGAAQMGTIELHSCSATADRIDRPDCMVFDLDPDPGLPWASVVEAARLTKVVLDELGLRSFLKTSGGRGLHLVVPLARRHAWDDISDFSEAVAQHMAKTIPSRFSAKMGAKNRVGKIFIDYLRNKRQASTVTPYSARARPGLPVATPIAWEELDTIGGANRWTIATLPDRLAALKKDPWAEYFETRQTLTATMKKQLGLSKK